MIPSLFALNHHEKKHELTTTLTTKTSWIILRHEKKHETIMKKHRSEPGVASTRSAVGNKAATSRGIALKVATWRQDGVATRAIGRSKRKRMQIFYIIYVCIYV